MLDILVLNPYSPEFYYVPVGTFALCDWLQQHGFSARIVNLAHDPPSEVLEHVDKAVAEYQPRQIGLILHWKETLNAFLSIGDHLRRNHPSLPIWAGGITASFFAKTLLPTASFLKGIVQGDAEIPMAKLCAGEDPAHIPNLFLATSKGVQAPCDFWWADGKFLNDLRYGRLNVLDDHLVYLRMIDTRLGVPLAPGRGCELDCGYCGGSKSAFRIHSNRPRIALRSAARIVDDVEDAFECGARTFLLSHTVSLCRKVLAEIDRRFRKPLPFCLHLECWDAPDPALLKLYAGLGCPQSSTRQILLSLHGSQSAAARSDEQRTVLKATDTALRLDSKVQVTIFCAYFTTWHQDTCSLDLELANIIRLRKRYSEGRVNIALMALSTDPGSRWATNFEGMEAHADLASIARGITAERTLANNLLLHRPAGLSIRDAQSFQRLQYLDTLLFDEVLVLWSLLTTAFQFSTYRSLLEHAGRALCYVHNDRVYPTSLQSLFFALAALQSELGKMASRNNDVFSFVNEFVSLWLASMNALTPQRRPFVCSGPLPGYLVLNPDAVYYSPFNFDVLLDEFYRKRRISMTNIRRTLEAPRTFAYLLLPELSAAQPESEMRLLSMFDGVTNSDNAIRRICAFLRAPENAVSKRILHLWRTRVLISA